MARSRDDDDDDLPRRRPRDEDDDDERPRRRRRSGGNGELGPLDGMYRDTNIVVLVLFGLCCSGIAFIMSLIALITAKDPTAKSNAMICMIVAIVWQVIAGIGYAVILASGGLR